MSNLKCSDWMCELCYPNCYELGMVLPGYSLIFKDDKYHILGGQGHRGDIILTLDHKPTIDPDPECETTCPITENASTLWYDNVFEPCCALKLCPQEGWALVESARELGWQSKTELFACWLANRLGQIVKEYENDN